MRELQIDREVAIVGIGQSKFRARSNAPLEEMILSAIRGALNDAGLTSHDVDGIVTEADTMPQIFDAHHAIVNLGLRGDIFTAHTGLSGAGIMLAPRLAALALKAGLATHVVSYFGVDWGTKRRSAYDWHARIPAKASLELPYGFYSQPSYFAQLTQRYMYEYGISESELGAVATSARAWAQLNPDAQERTPMSLDQYFQSPMIADPVKKADCCLLTDGAVAFVMTTPERAKDLRSKPVRVAACETSYSPESVQSHNTQRDPALVTEAVHTAPVAMRKAGITTAAVDFVNVYDCFTVSALMQFEDMGFCEKGEAGAFFAEGNTAPGGRLPVNPHGGMLSEAYLMGINNIAEAVKQIRGEAGARQIPGAEVGVLSGYSAQQTTLVLTASR